jgi:hypothetical protein
MTGEEASELNNDLGAAIRPKTAGEQPAVSKDHIKQALAKNFAKKLLNPKKL